jgi:hypothetical protein
MTAVRGLELWTFVFRAVRPNRYTKQVTTDSLLFFLSGDARHLPRSRFIRPRSRFILPRTRGRRLRAGKGRALDGQGAQLEGARGRGYLQESGDSFD